MLHMYSEERQKHPVITLRVPPDIHEKLLKYIEDNRLPRSKAAAVLRILRDTL